MKQFVNLQTTNCNNCGNVMVAYQDIHCRAITCPTCNTVKGVLWKEGIKYQQYNRGNVPSHLLNESAYDWGWLEYDKVQSNPNR